MVQARLMAALTVFAALATAAGCATSAGGQAVAARVSTTTTAPTVLTTTTTTPTTTAPTTTTTTSLPPTTMAPLTSTTSAASPRRVTEQAWTPFATVGGVTLHHPAALVERVGFHESNHDGAQQLELLPTAVAPVTMETRDRGTGSRTAADAVVDPTAEIRSPVTGTVKRAGSYTLYCDNTDNYVVIEPDDHPGWEVKVLHIDGLLVATGDRVVAGETPLAPHARQLPFPSQVDELATVLPPWPHVHMEVVDPTVPDRPGPPCP